MKPLILLLVVFVASSLISWLATGTSAIVFSGNLAMCAMLFLTGLGHFLFTKGMTMMFPPSIPYKTALVYLTGVAEPLLGLALLSPTLRPYAGYILVGFFILALPTNVYAAMRRVDLEKGNFTGPGLGYLWFRVPLQGVFIGWVMYFSF